VRRIWELGQGHPWLTNALAGQIVGRDVRDRSTAITAQHVEAAKETIILECRSHIDALVARLREPRVRRILALMLTGGTTEGDVLDDDFAYVVGLGLVRLAAGQWGIANPIYQEIIPRSLAYVQQGQIAVEPAVFVRLDGSLDMGKLMADWQVFCNGGGKIVREYGLGRVALDLVVEWRGQRHAIEVKLRRDTTTEERALEQVAGYLDRLGLGEGWLVMFDLRQGLSWEEKITMREVEHRGKRVHVVGC
jgi:hypothetical protein